MLFEHFQVADVPTPRGDVHVRIGGAGPPLLLLHGFPETHLMWHAVASTLGDRFTVVAADLPGYGESFHPPVTTDHSAHSKRALAVDLLAAMRELGHEPFAVAGHDRGGRVAYRMALDEPSSVSRLAVLDIVPTGEIWSRADAKFAIGYWHWSFLAQPPPLPERLILGDPDAFWLAAQRLGLKADERCPRQVSSAYRAQFSKPETVEAMCEDYRAGATIDRQLDDADQGRRAIACPVLTLWGGDGALPRFYEDPVEPWRTFAPQIWGHPIPAASHFLVQDAPEEIAAELAEFFG